MIRWLQFRCAFWLIVAAVFDGTHALSAVRADVRRLIDATENIGRVGKHE